MEKAEDLDRHLKSERELVFKQQERINKERESNVFLCNTIADLERKVVDLERKLASVKMSNGNPTEINC